LSSAKRISGSFWLVFAGLCVGLIIFRYEATIELGYFLPEPETLDEQVLVRRLGQGAGSQLWFIVAPPSPQTQAFISELRESGLFRSVYAGNEPLSVSSVPETVWRYRYLLADADWSESGVAEAVDQRLADLLLLPDQSLSQIVFSDPFLVVPGLLERLVVGSAETAWQDDSGRKYLLAETNAPAFDMEAQAEVQLFVHRAAETKLSAGVASFGAGPYGLRLQERIRNEAQWRSLLAALLVMLVLLTLYRRFSVLWLAALPVLAGAVGGFAALTLFFDKVHGITLAFGFTLLGVAVDYPLHVISHARRGAGRVKNIRSVMFVSVASTLIAFAALVFSGSPGLAQLGVFSFCGILVALLCSLTLLPCFLAEEEQAVLDQRAVPSLLQNRYWILLLCAGFAVLLAQSRPLWTDDLSSMTPLPEHELQADKELRERFAVPDMRYLLLAEGATEQTVLFSAHRASEVLRLAGFEVLSVSDLVPPESIQNRRIEQVVAFSPEWLSTAERSSGFREGSFDAFADAVSVSRNLPLLQSDDWQGTQFEALVNENLYSQDGGWRVGLLPFQLENPQIFGRWLRESLPDWRLIDLKEASASLVGRYRNAAKTALLFAAILVAVLLWWFTGSLRHWVWLVGTVSAAVLTSALLSVWLLGTLSLLNMVALILVAGLGLDYALFTSCAGDAERTADSRHAVLASALSTAAAFGLLGLSSVPVLAGIGTTVSIGVMISYALARFTAGPDGA